jgi:sugar phosphate isomerase/epimerase
MSWHPRISVDEECAGYSTPFVDEVSFWTELGVTNIGVISPKMEAINWDPALVAQTGLVVSNIGTEERLVPKALEFGAAVGADSVWLMPGSIGSRTWEEAAADFGKRIAPAVTRAQELGIPLALHPTTSMNTHISFVFTLRDALELARQTGIGNVVLELTVCWYERGLERLLREDIGAVKLVQIADMELGTRVWPSRCVIGDGAIPLERILAMLLDAGYEGMFDLEQLGPKIEDEGYLPATRRSLERLSEMLARVGA